MPTSVQPDLTSPDSRTRGMSAYYLSQSFDNSIGDSLVEAFINETEPEAFAWLCRAVVGKWAVKLETRLQQYEYWPMIASNTVLFVENTRGWRYPSYEKFVLDHLRSEDWLYRFAGLIYSRDKGLHLEIAKPAAAMLRAELQDTSRDWDKIAVSAGFLTKQRLEQRIRHMSREFDWPL